MERRATMDFKGWRGDSQMVAGTPWGRQEPSYLKLGLREVQARSDQAIRGLSRCAVCARACLVDRRQGPVGPCRTGRLARVASFFPHFGEEAPISGHRGSGTVFFAGCNLACVYCQNSDISHGDDGREVTDEQLGGVMLRLQEMGCHNVNLVSPSHVVPQFLSALASAMARGFRLPIVYNTGGYDSVRTLRLLDGIVDIYMPDAKYGDDRVAERFSGIRGYVKANGLALKEMHRQVGDLAIDASGVATRGLLIRHLVLPAGLAGTERVLRFLSEELSPNSYCNVMAQYHPCFQALSFSVLGRRITPGEYAEALAIARACGLTRGLPD